LNHGLGDGTTGLLIKKRHAVGKTQEMNRFVSMSAVSGARSWRLLVHMAAFVDLDASVATATIRNRDFNLKWISAVGCCWPGADGVEVCRDLFAQSFQELFFPDRNDAISAGG
jgi:hypothetical protein